MKTFVIFDVKVKIAMCSPLPNFKGEYFVCNCIWRP